MLFPTGIFALFFAVVFLGHWSLVRFRPAWDKPFLLAANLAFCAFWSVEFCAALILVGLWAWGIGLLVCKGRGRAWLWLGIAGALAWLSWFKYTNFFLQELVARLDWLGLGPIVRAAHFLPQLHTPPVGWIPSWEG